MKVGIITFQDNNNYGNRLQNYATNFIMKDYGIEADTIIIKTKEDYFVSLKYKKEIKDAIKTALPIRFLNFCGICKKRLVGDKLKNARERAFHKVNKQYMISKTYYINCYEELFQDKRLQSYDYFLVGSDQVWNPHWAGQDKYFLTFTSPEKRIAFIASVGATELPAVQQKRYTSLLKQMKYISVREESAVKLIRQLTGIEVDCFFDPVLLVDKGKWIAIEEPIPFKTPSKYILSFFLGEEPNEAIRQFADRKKLKVIHMDQREYPEYYTLNPAQLLYMIKNAAYILTDSFHVTAFSIIFQKQFFVFRRKQENMENMFSRMETLLGRLGLMERIQDASQIEETGSISEEQYREIAKMLVMERKRLDETMKKVLK